MKMVAAELLYCLLVSDTEEDGLTLTMVTTANENVKKNVGGNQCR